MEKATGVELHNAYSRARFTVFPSLHEGFGLPVAESLEHGTPVITTNYGSTEEIGRDGGAILIDSNDDEELVAAMRRLLTDDELIEQLRREHPRSSCADMGGLRFRSLGQPRGAQSRLIGT